MNNEKNKNFIFIDLDDNASQNLFDFYAKQEYNQNGGYGPNYTYTDLMEEVHGDKINWDLFTRGMPATGLK